jgi:hypothetical protein
MLRVNHGRKVTRGWVQCIWCFQLVNCQKLTHDPGGQIKTLYACKLLSFNLRGHDISIVDMLDGSPKTNKSVHERHCTTHLFIRLRDVCWLAFFQAQQHSSLYMPLTSQQISLKLSSELAHHSRSVFLDIPRSFFSLFDKRDKLSLNTAW